MRIASKLERTSKDWKPKSKYYIIPEGEKTEIQYFNGIRENRQELNINSLIEIILIENDETEKGESHPKKKIQNFKDDIEAGKFVFYEELDKVCFVIDRDPQNLSELQLVDFIQQCTENNYEVYLSNPTFELFLIMHSDDILKLNKQEMLENRKVNRNKRFLEKKLSNIFGCSKTNLNFEKFKPYISKAIKNEKQFCEKVEDLKTKLGSNVGILLNSMIENKEI